VSIGPWLCAACGAAWIAGVAWRTPGSALAAVARGVVGSLVAVALAWAGYFALDRAGAQVSWSEVLGGGASSFLMVGAIGMVEEGAKLVGMALASVGARPGGRSVATTVLSVSAGFAALEAAISLATAEPELALVRALLAPVAHAALSAPLALVLVGGRSGMRWIVPALLLAAALHGAADLSLATRFGRAGYAAVLIAPPVLLHLNARFGLLRAARAGAGSPRPA
jgi:RsiW-degrading membrane proteinase PrsW (M82 family)